MVRAHVAAGLLCVVLISDICSASAKQPLTVARALETTRIMTNMEAAGPANPDGAV